MLINRCNITNPKPKNSLNTHNSSKNIKNTVIAACSILKNFSYMSHSNRNTVLLHSDFNVLRWVFQNVVAKVIFHSTLGNLARYLKLFRGSWRIQTSIVSPAHDQGGILQFRKLWATVKQLPGSVITFSYLRGTQSVWWQHPSAACWYWGSHDHGVGIFPYGMDRWTDGWSFDKLC